MRRLGDCCGWNRVDEKDSFVSSAYENRELKVLSSLDSSFAELIMKQASKLNFIRIQQRRRCVRVELNNVLDFKWK